MLPHASRPRSACLVQCPTNNLCKISCHPEPASSASGVAPAQRNAERANESARCVPKGSRAANFGRRDSSEYVGASKDYILASRSGTLYIGVTNDLARRIYEHKWGLAPGFTRKYKVHYLVYVEEFASADEAIAREKQLKGWTRRKKLALVQSANPTMRDLSVEWLKD
jgi:putative endonuclease